MCEMERKVINLCAQRPLHPAPQYVSGGVHHQQQGDSQQDKTGMKVIEASFWTALL